MMRTMTNLLIDSALPAQLAESSQVIETQVKLSDVQRLRELVETDLANLIPTKIPQEWQHGTIDIKLAFGWADINRQIPALEGKVSTTIIAVCQRCLEPFKLTLNAQLKLMLLTPSCDVIAFEKYEIWEIVEDTVRPIEIVDEVLIMAMPLSVVHEDYVDCGPLVKKLLAKELDKTRPFADLKLQMSSLNR
jgi:hypothetical protein